MEQMLAKLRARFLPGPSGEEEAAAQRAREASRYALAPARRRVRIEGRVSEVTVRPRSESVPDLVVDLDPFDTSVQPASLVMLGRREVVGIHVGPALAVEGLLTTVKNRPTIFNPAYELLLENEESQ